MKKYLLSGACALLLLSGCVLDSQRSDDIVSSEDEPNANPPKEKPFRWENVAKALGREYKSPLGDSPRENRKTKNNKG
jgi:hypothetical protein